MAPLDYSRVTLAGQLWTVDEAKVHLRIRGTDHDADITQKLAAAQEAIIGYLGTAADPTWIPATAPLAVKHAIFLLAAHWYEHRGDDTGASAPGAPPDAGPWADIRELLKMYRDPALA
jgi:hypothetical protein